MNMNAYRHTPSDTQAVRIAREIIANDSAFSGFSAVCGEDKKTIELPADISEIMLKILKMIASGQGVTVMPASAELTTAQGAEMLRVSRPFFIKLLEENKIPFRKVGKHRRVRSEDILSYKEKIDAEREKILDMLAENAQAEGMGY